MNQYVAEKLAHFEASIASAPPIWQSVDLRWSAVQIGGEWHNLGTRAYADGRRADAVPRLPHAPGVNGKLKCGQVVISFSELIQRMREALEGQLTIGGVTIHYLKLSAASAATPYDHVWAGPEGRPTVQGREVSYWDRRTDIEWAAECFRAFGTAGGDLVRQVEESGSVVDEALRVQPHPYDGIAGAKIEFLGDPGGFEAAETVGLEVFAPYRASLEQTQCRYSGDELHYSIRCADPILKDHLRLGVFTKQGDVPTPETILLGASEWEVDGSEFHLTGSLAIEPSAGTKLFLNAGNRCIHQVRVPGVGDLSAHPRLSAYATIDPDLEILRKNLNPGASRANLFESAVARLFYLLGFAVDLLGGDRGLQDAVDFTAATPDGNLFLAVECTTGPIDANGKLGKLKARAHALAGALAPVRVQAVIISALDREKLIASEVAAAEEEGIVVLASEDIDQLLPLLDHPSAVARVSSRILRTRQEAARGRVSGALNWRRRP